MSHAIYEGVNTAAGGSKLGRSKGKREADWELYKHPPTILVWTGAAQLLNPTRVSQAQIHHPSQVTQACFMCAQ